MPVILHGVMGSLSSKIKHISGGAVGEIGLDLGANKVSITDLKYDPDEKWSNLYREKGKNHMYKWVGVKEGKLY